MELAFEGGPPWQPAVDPISSHRHFFALPAGTGWQDLSGFDTLEIPTR
jgi:hypothetical protein